MTAYANGNHSGANIASMCGMPMLGCELCRAYGDGHGQLNETHKGKHWYADHFNNKR